MHGRPIKVGGKTLKTNNSLKNLGGDVKRSNIHGLKVSERGGGGKIFNGCKILKFSERQI